MTCEPRDRFARGGVEDPTGPIGAGCGKFFPGGMPGHRVNQILVNFLSAYQGTRRPTKKLDAALRSRASPDHNKLLAVWREGDVVHMQKFGLHFSQGFEVGPAVHLDASLRSNNHRLALGRKCKGGYRCPGSRGSGDPWNLWWRPKGRVKERE